MFKNSPHKGQCIIIFLTFLFSIASFFLVYFVLRKYRPNNLNLTEGLIFSSLIGISLMIIIFICIDILTHLLISIKRIFNFLVNLKYSLRTALALYKLDVNQNGLLFLIYFSLFSFFLIIFISSLNSYFNYS